MSKLVVQHVITIICLYFKGGAWSCLGSRMYMEGVVLCGPTGRHIVTIGTQHPWHPHCKLDMNDATTGVPGQSN